MELMHQFQGANGAEQQNCTKLVGAKLYGNKELSANFFSQTVPKTCLQKADYSCLRNPRCEEVFFFKNGNFRWAVGQLACWHSFQVISLSIPTIQLQNHGYWNHYKTVCQMVQIIYAILRSGIESSSICGENC